MFKFSFQGNIHLYMLLIFNYMLLTLACAINKVAKLKRFTTPNFFFHIRADRAGSRVQVELASQVLTGGRCGTIGTPVCLEGSEKYVCKSGC